MNYFMGDTSNKMRTRVNTKLGWKYDRARSVKRGTIQALLSKLTQLYLQSWQHRDPGKYIRQQNNACASLPLGLTVEQGTGRMYINHLTVYKHPIAFLRILLGRISKESWTHSFLDSHGILTSWYNIKLVPEKRHILRWQYSIQYILQFVLCMEFQCCFCEGKNSLL